MNINVHCKGLEHISMNDTRLMTIGELSKMLGITRRMIINYEDMGLVEPDKRGQGSSGYRYYTIDTMTRIRCIRTFQSLGLSLEEIKGYLEGSADLLPVLRRLENLRCELDLSIARIRERIRPAEVYSAEIITIPQQTVYRRSARASSIELRTRQLRDVASETLHKYQINLTKHMYWIEFSLEDPDLITYNAAVSDDISGENVVQLPAVQAIAAYHHGSYEYLPHVRSLLLDHAKKHGIVLSGQCRHIFLEGPPQHKNPDHYITLVALPIQESTEGEN